MPGLGSPYFQHADSRAGAVVNVTTQLESATYLDCHVNRLGGKTVGKCAFLFFASRT